MAAIGFLRANAEQTWPQLPLNGNIGPPPGSSAARSRRRISISSILFLQNFPCHLTPMIASIGWSTRNVLRRQLSLSPRPIQRSLSARAHTIFSPTPAAVEAFLAKNPAPTKSSSLYLLSTSIPPSDLSPILVSLQKHLSSSVGSFCTSSPGGPSSLSIVTFPEARTWRSDLSGRPPPEVGRWHRPREETAEDRKGRLEGEGLLAQETHGWDKMWEPDSGSERIPDLDGVEWVDMSFAARREIKLKSQGWYRPGTE
jgi:hypothetical protein